MLKTVFQYLVAPIITAIIIAPFMLVAQFWIQPLIQERIKIHEELWLHKKQIYFKAAELIDERFDSMKFNDSEPVREAPIEKEMNDVYRELLLVSDNEEILTSFQKFMDASIEDYCSPANRGKFLKLLRDDLGKSDLSADDEKIPYFREH